MKEFKTIIDANGRAISGLMRSDHVDARVISAGGAAESHTVPTDAQYVVFSGNGDFYVNFDAVAVVPSTDVTDGTASLLKPTVRAIEGASYISLISPASGATVVTMEFYR